MTGPTTGIEVGGTDELGFDLEAFPETNGIG